MKKGGDVLITEFLISERGSRTAEGELSLCFSLSLSLSLSSSLTAVAAYQIEIEMKLLRIRRNHRNSNFAERSDQSVGSCFSKLPLCIYVCSVLRRRNSSVGRASFKGPSLVQLY